MILIGVELIIFYRPTANWLLLVFPVLLIIVFIRNNSPYIRSGLSTLILALLLNFIFYPDLLKYQSGNQMAFHANKEHPGKPVSRLGLYIPSGEFYLKEHMTRRDGQDSVDHSASGLFFVSEDELNLLKGKSIPYQILKEFDEFHVTMLTLKFLNPATRKKELKKRYLVTI